MASRVGDLTDRQFGMLTVKRLVGKDKHYDKIWLCECECGNFVEVKQGHLRSGHTISCGCRRPQLKDYTGRKFGSLFVRERIDDYVCPGNGKYYVRYRCECDCGSIVDVIGLNLKSLSTTSCGCQNPTSFSDLSGRRFGKLKVRYRVDDYVNPSGRKLVRYLCDCECGNQVLELANTLRSGGSESCGCGSKSRSEVYVGEFFLSLGIKYDLHKTFDGCVSDLGNKLSYDFYLPDHHALIECNGAQHYDSIEFFGGQERLGMQQRHDALKEQFAVSNGFSYLVLDCRNIVKRKDVILKELSEFIDTLC